MACINAVEEKLYDAYVETDGKTYHFELLERDFRDLTSSALYGSGWFRFKENTDTVLLNLRQVKVMRIAPRES